MAVSSLYAADAHSNDNHLHDCDFFRSIVAVAIEFYEMDYVGVWSRSSAVGNM